MREISSEAGCKSCLLLVDPFDEELPDDEPLVPDELPPDELLFDVLSDEFTDEPVLDEVLSGLSVLSVL